MRIIEVELGHVYAIFGDRYFKAEAYDDYYEEGGTNKKPHKSVKEAANRYFPKSVLKSPIKVLKRTNK